MPAANVPSIGNAAAKWARRAQSAGGEYEQGVRGAGARWASGAKAAAPNYAAGVTAAAGAGRYARGIDRAGPAKYEGKASRLGPGRYSQGVADAEPQYQAAFAPFLDVIGRTDLPARGPVGADANYARVAAIGKALRALAVGR